MQSVKGTQKSQMPREKLAKKGVKALSDLELLQALIGSGNAKANVNTIAKNVYTILKKQGADITFSDLHNLQGMGTAKSTEIMAAFELSRRYITESELPIIDSTAKAVEQLADIRKKQQEHFVVMSLDGANRLIAKRTITIGTLNSSLVHPREVFADAITDRAASIIVAHNHPSGGLTASAADLQVTKRIQQAGGLLGISVLEHIIVTKDSHTSIAE